MFKVYTTEGLNGRQKLDYWFDSLTAVCGNFSVRYSEPTGSFRGKIGLWSGDHFDIATIAGNARSISRSRKQAMGDGHPYYFFIIQRCGRSLIRQNGQECVLQPGDFTLIDSQYPSEFSQNDDFKHVSLHIPRTWIAQRQGLHPLPSARRIAGDRGMGAIAVGLAFSAIEQAPALDDTQAALVKSTIRDTLFWAYTQDPEVTSILRRESLKEEQLLRIKSLVESNLGDPELTPQRIAHQCGLSERQLYRIFREDGLAIGEWIKRQRLIRCAAALTNLDSHRESITAIAYRWGFSDPAHFSRAFKRQFQVSPRRFRRMAEHSPARKQEDSGKR